jgi:hypothetical protein
MMNRKVCKGRNSEILPRDAGEDREGGLNGAQRLNGLNDLNGS